MTDHDVSGDGAGVDENGVDVGSEGKRTIGVGTLCISQKEKDYVNQALDNNRLSYGPFCRRFEKEFASIHDCKFGVLSNSGTSALHVAIGVLKEEHDWEEGDEVIIPAVTFVATANVVIHNRLTPVFVDVEREYYGIDPAEIEEKITPRTKAIIVVHLFGMPCDMEPIIALAKKHNLKIIEDSCETMFAKYKGKMTGSLGDIGCFSTYVAHLLTTGVGGLNTTNNHEYAVKLRSLVNHGRDSIYISIDDDTGKSKEEMKEIIAKRFSFVSVGHSFRITEMEAALGCAQLESWKEMIATRRSNAQKLLEGLSDLKEHVQLPAIREGAEHSFMMFPLVLHNEEKTALVNFLEEKGIETRDMLPLINQPIYKELYGVNETDYPVADWINKNGFYIGSHQGMTSDDITYIVEAFHAYFKEI